MGHSSNSDDGIHPNLKLLSHSSEVLLHKCPRKYELYKMLPQKDNIDESDEHLDFGTAVGIGVQEYLTSGNEERARFAIFLAWKKYIDDDEGQFSRKTFWHSIHALNKFIGFRKTALGNFELAFFAGKPAIELGYEIDLGDGFKHRGLLDALLIDKTKNELAVYEGKTTKNKDLHDAMYKHSGQALGYSLLTDTISKLIGSVVLGSSFKVRYAIYKTFRYEWELMVFNKSFTHRAMWIKNVLLDKKRIIDYATDGYFPMYGENCYDFFRPCPYFGTCELSNQFLIGNEVPVKTEKEDKYPFKFHINEIIQAQLEAHEEVQNAVD